MASVRRARASRRQFKHDDGTKVSFSLDVLLPSRRNKTLALIVTQSGSGQLTRTPRDNVWLLIVSSRTPDNRLVALHILSHSDSS